MQEIAKVILENEMDLILAHKRSMKLAELAGLPLSAQTTFATAVSEVSRNPIESGKKGILTLKVENSKRDRYIVACLKEEQPHNEKFMEGLEYAKRLVNKHNVVVKGAETSIELFYFINPSFRIDLAKLDEWRTIFRNEPPVSPYEELKRKNELLYELSENVKKSEAHYKIVTNSLPLVIFSIDTKGKLLYANEWLFQCIGETADHLNSSRWRSVVHPDDYESFSLLLKNEIAKEITVIKTQSRLKEKASGEYLWHQISLSPFKNDKDELQYWIGYMVDINAQKVFEETLQDNIELKETQKQLKDNQQMLESYITELNRSNFELQQFAYIASHDLQEPARKLLFYSDFMLQQYKDKIDQKGSDFLQSMQASAYRMRNLIQDLLTFSQINKHQLEFCTVDLNQVANDAVQDLEISIEEKKAVLDISSLPSISGDASMMRQLFENIISNSIKYANPGMTPLIHISSKQQNGSHIISFKDNGIGFNEKYLPQMFTLFQRLHNRKEYEGTGLGLAICRKIVEIHQGKIWAEAEEGKGATFYVSLPANQLTG